MVKKRIAVSLTIEATKMLDRMSNSNGRTSSQQVEQMIRDLDEENRIKIVTQPFESRDTIEP